MCGGTEASSCDRMGVLLCDGMEAEVLLHAETEVSSCDGRHCCG